MYLSAFCGLLDFSTGEFRYSNFGHPPQLLFQRKNSKVNSMDSQNTLLGVSRLRHTGQAGHQADDPPQAVAGVDGRHEFEIHAKKPGDEIQRQRLIRPQSNWYRNRNRVLTKFY